MGGICPGGICPGGICPGGICLGGGGVCVLGCKCPGGYMSGGKCPGGTCPFFLSCHRSEHNISGAPMDEHCIWSKITI